MFQCFVCLIYAFSFFDLFRRIDFCLGCIVVFSMSRMLKNEMGLVFLVFLTLIFKLSKLLNFDLNFQKSRISPCYGVLTLCPYCSHSSLDHSSSVLAPTFILVLLIFNSRPHLLSRLL